MWVCSQEMWVGQGTPGTPQLDGTTGFQAVAVKVAPLDDAVRQERRALRLVQDNVQELNIPGPHHLTMLLDHWKIKSPESTTQVLITRYTVWPLHPRSRLGLGVLMLVLFLDTQSMRGYGVHSGTGMHMDMMHVMLQNVT